jgi:hypothetical protein
MNLVPNLLQDSVARAPGHRGSGASTWPHLTDLSKLRRATTQEAGSRNELAWLLVLDNLVDAGEAESRWLDHVGTRLMRGATRAPGARARSTAGSHSQRSTESESR